VKIYRWCLHVCLGPRIPGPCVGIGCLFWSHAFPLSFVSLSPLPFVLMTDPCSFVVSCWSQVLAAAVTATPPLSLVLRSRLCHEWNPWPDFHSWRTLGGVPRYEPVPMLIFSGLVHHAGESRCYILEVSSLRHRQSCLPSRGLAKLLHCCG